MFILTEIQRRFQIKKIREQQKLVNEYSRLAIIVGAVFIVVCVVVSLAL